MYFICWRQLFFYSVLFSLYCHLQTTCFPIRNADAFVSVMLLVLQVALQQQSEEA